MTEVIDAGLKAQLEKCKDLPTPPVVATKIIELSGASNTDVNTLASIVAMDPSLSAKILSIANSSLYMRRVEADSIQQAVAMFGWTGTLNIALSFAVMGSIRGQLSSGIDYDYFWRRSLAAAVAARKLGQVLNCKNEDILFLPGLLQDIGILALDRTYPDLYTDVAGGKQQDHVYLQNLEWEKINSDHAVAGQWLLEDWRVPKEVSQLVGLSHSVDYKVQNQQNMAAQKSIYLSGVVADCLVAEDSDQFINSAQTALQRHAKVDANDLFPLLGHVANQFIEIASIFGIEVGDIDKLHSMQGFAALSMLND